MEQRRCRAARACAMEPVGVNVPVAGSYSSAAVLQPPAMSTRPSASSVAVSPRGPSVIVVDIEPVQVNRAPGPAPASGTASARAVRPRPRSQPSTAAARWPPTDRLPGRTDRIASSAGCRRRPSASDERRAAFGAVGVHRPPARERAAGPRTNRIRPSGVQVADDRAPVRRQATHVGPVGTHRVDVLLLRRRSTRTRSGRRPGDQSGFVAASVVGLSWRRFWPSASTTQIASSLGATGPPPLSFSPYRKKTIWVPSGDQAGAALTSDRSMRSSTTRRSRGPSWRSPRDR